jgi:hypothetical protein
VVAHLTVARVAEGLGVAWDTANNAVLAEVKRLLINDPTRFEGVKVIGVDEHVWRHIRRGDKYVTMIIDLTPVRDGAGPARLLDMVEARDAEHLLMSASSQTNATQAASHNSGSQPQKHRRPRRSVTRQTPPTPARRSPIRQSETIVHGAIRSKLIHKPA